MLNKPILIRENHQSGARIDKHIVHISYVLSRDLFVSSALQYHCNTEEIMPLFVASLRAFILSQDKAHLPIQ